MEIQPFDPRQATDRECAAINTFGNRMRLEHSPDDPPLPLEEEIRRLRNIPEFVTTHDWIVWSDDGSELIASGDVNFARADHNRHVVDLYIGVLPEYRRRGIARKLLPLLANATAQEDRTLMIAGTRSTVPAGEAFMRRLGAQMGLPMHINQLDMRDLKRELIPLWQQRAQERATGFELLIWTEGIPEEYLEPYLQVVEAMNRAPRGDLRVEDWHWTPEQLRQWQASDQARGNQRWIIVAREKATGAFAGFTEVEWHPNRPELLGQGATAVLPPYQNRGLGRWIKAAMLDKVLRERPQVKRIRTGNAFVNEPMLKINTELGFKPYQSRYWWQIEVSKVKEYLSERSAPASAPSL